MKSFFNTSIATIAILAALIACNKMESPADDLSNQNGKRTCRMELNGSVSGYDGSILRSVGTKGSASWKDGDVIYITFLNGNTIIPGTAQYSVSDGWNITYDADIPEGSNQNCEVRFFVNTNFAYDSFVSMNSETEVYEDVSAKFSFASNVISITANLTPKTGRIRFTGNSRDNIYLTGISTYTTFSPAANKFTTSAAMVPLTVNSDGYTPYTYGVFTYDDRKISIIGSDFAYTRNCKDSIFLPGDSGYMAIPSKTSHNSWRSGVLVTVNGVDFKMLPVAGLDSGFFLLGETEVTRTQFGKVIGDSYNGNTPYETYYSSWQSFITKLNDATALHFYIPSLKEWQFAAKGGELSLGYIYAGSNTPGDVAWYSGNAKGSVHEVKQLAPNELGLYDMSGNSEEFVTDTGRNSNGYTVHYACGGSYTYSEDNVTIASHFLPSSSNSYCGLRLALKCN